MVGEPASNQNGATEMINTPYNGETNGLLNPSAYHAESCVDTVYWTEPGLKIIRLRLISDPGFPVWDVSYCDGRLPSGEKVNVELPFFQLPKGKGGINKALIAYAKKDGLFAKGLGLFDGVISTLI